jgi:hypothetical protein
MYPVNLPVSQATRFLNFARNDIYAARLTDGLRFI